MDHLALAISKESKQTESACCAILEKAFGKETVLTASVLQKPIALSSAVCMKTDQRALGNGSLGHNSDSPTCVIHNPTSTRSEVSCCEKNDLLSFILVVEDIDKTIKISDDVENVYDGKQNVARKMLETTMQ